MSGILPKYKGLIGLIVGVALVVAIPIMAFRYFQHGVFASYYEWSFMGILASYIEENDGDLPKNWDDLKGYEYYSMHFSGSHSIDDAMRYIAIDFEELARLKNGEITGAESKVIATIKGMDIHWVYPGFELEKYFRDGVLPSGALERDEADKHRMQVERSQSNWPASKANSNREKSSSANVAGEPDSTTSKSDREAPSGSN